VLASKTPYGLKGIAVFEAFKGLLGLVLGVAFVILGHEHFHFRFQFADKFLQLVEGLDIRVVLLGTIAYAILRFTEAYGLWRDRTWAEWLAIISSAIYIPFEFFEIYEKPTALRITITVFNLILLIYLVILRKHKHDERKHSLSFVNSNV
jgi:uncharacterized membrane protein (DUF2068 family)